MPGRIASWAFSEKSLIVVNNSSLILLLYRKLDFYYPIAPNDNRLVRRWHTVSALGVHHGARAWRGRLKRDMMARFSITGKQGCDDTDPAGVAGYT